MLPELPKERKVSAKLRDSAWSWVGGQEQARDRGRDPGVARGEEGLHHGGTGGLGPMLRGALGECLRIGHWEAGAWGDAWTGQWVDRTIHFLLRIN